MQVDYWKIQQEMSKEGKSIDNLSQCIDYFVDNNISSDLRTIMDFSERFGLKTSVIKPLPETVKKCFSSFIKMVKPERIFNSFVQNGTLAECIASMGYSVTCRSKSDLDKKIVRLLKLKEYRKDSDDKYDLFIADLTFSIPEWFFDEITEFVPKLHDDGSMVFILPSSIVYSNNLLKKVRALEEVGLFAKAYIDLPNNSYAPYTSVSGKLVVFDKYETEDVFFAKIFVDTDIETIIKCYFNHKDAKKDNQGRWFTKGLYEDYREFEKEQRAKKLEKAFNGKLMRLPELYKGAYRPKNNRFTERENCIYLPSVGHSDVVTSLEQLTIKPQNYIQVVLKDTVSPDYIAFFYNTDKGRAIRDDYAVGETILHHSLQSIKKLPIILPEEDIQKEFLKTESEIYRLEIEVERLRQKFLVSPAAYKTIRRDMKNVNNHEDALERWISQLPYPLSTILRKYIVDDSYEKKQETLFYFFEAYSQFLATILTSVIANHKELFVKNHIFRNTSYTHYEKASFGNWVILNQMIIKEMNRTLATLEGKSVVYEAFGTSERDLLELLCNKDVCNILYEVSQQRNSWKGHTGITSALDYEEHVRKLHDSLLQIQLRTKDLFERIQLIRSTSLKYTRKRYIHTIEILTGSDPLFKKAEFVSDYPLDSEKLYIQYMGSESTIELIPMIIFGSSPASSKSACYFYNRVENGNTRYVSYHYEGQPEDIESGMSAFEIIKEMME